MCNRLPPAKNGSFLFGRVFLMSTRFAMVAVQGDNSELPSQIQVRFL